MGDRVAVMRSGVLQQCDHPQVLYNRPDNLFVAAFIGSSAMTAGPRPTLVADVDLVEALGAELIVHFTIDARGVRPEGATDADTEAVTEADEGVARVDPDAPVKPGERCTFSINTSGMRADFLPPPAGSRSAVRQAGLTRTPLR